MKCIICHMEIGTEKSVECPNNHSTHEDCFKEWLVHSNRCPLCSTEYSQEVIKTFQSFLDQKDAEKKEAIINQIRLETSKNIENIAEKMVFLKFVETIEELLEKKDFDLALDRLEAHGERKLMDFKGQNLLFLKGKLNYLRGRYDLAINFLFKLVKVQFDYPEAFLFLGKSYQELGLEEKAKWAFTRIKKL